MFETASYCFFACWREHQVVLLNYKFIKLQPFIRFVDVSATTAAVNKSKLRL